MSQSNLFSTPSTASPLPPKPKRVGTLYADGGSRGNPGPAAGGAVVYDAERQELERAGTHCGHATNNVAEYHGLILGLKVALQHDITHLSVRLDSQLIVHQLNGIWRVKHPDMKKLYATARALSDQFKSIDYQHVRREKNRVADSIVNHVLDQ